MKATIRTFLATPSMLRIWQATSGAGLALFTMHRFAIPDLGIAGHDPRQVADALASLRRHRIPILSLPEVVKSAQAQEPLPPRGVILTVDDGYFDFGEVGAPVFAQFDAPVTVFLVTGFLDGECWLWWDQVRFLIAAARGGLADPSLWQETGPNGATPGVEAMAGAISACATRIPQVELQRVITFLAGTSGIPVPATPPEWCRPLAWESVQRLTRHGVSFGPHTRSHPVLTATTDAVAASEVHGSWARLQEMLPQAVPVFSYPNGDHGQREVQLVKSAGLAGAVTTVPRSFVPATVQADPDGVFRIPRYAYLDETEQLLLTAAGFRRIQQHLGRG